MKRTIAIVGAAALMVAGTAFVVRAQTTGGVPACADLLGSGPRASSGSYTLPAENAVGVQTTAGKLNWTMELAAKSCPNVQYGLTVFLDGADPEAAAILASAATTGDGISDTFTFQLEINTHNADPDAPGVCVVQTTMGSGSSKNGAAFDGTGLRLLDRGPDGPIPGDDSSGDIYCLPVPDAAGRSAG